jgi:hypothetical protein
MTHKLLVEVPEDVFRALQKTASLAGQPLEVLAAERLSEATRDLENDPLEAFIGAFSSGITDWADKHDLYFNQSVMEEMTGR